MGDRERQLHTVDHFHGSDDIQLIPIVYYNLEQLEQSFGHVKPSGDLAIMILGLTNESALLTKIQKPTNI